MKKAKSILMLLLLLAVQTLAQSAGFNINFNGYRKGISSLNRMGVDYISVTQLSELLGGSVFYNPTNSKLEVRFNTVFVKFTAHNNFVVVTQKIGGLAVTHQFPAVPIEVNADFFVPAAVYAGLFADAAGRVIEYRKDLRELLVDAKDFTPEKPAERPAVKTPVVKTEEIKEPVITKQESKPGSGDANKETEKKEEINEPVMAAEVKDINKGNYDIYEIEAEVKSNGTLVRLRSKKKIAKFSTSLSGGVLYVNILGVSADAAAIGAIEPSGLLKKAGAKNMGANSQVELFLKDGYSKYEAFRDETGHDLYVSVHNKLLSKTAAPVKDARWTLRTVVIDPGHGGKDPGAIGVTGVREKDVNLAIALKLGEAIQNNMPDVKVVYTRQTDKFVELYKRGKIANEKNGNLFISIHCNSTPQKPASANGFEIYLLRPGRTKEAIAIAEMENKVIDLEDNPSKYQKLTAENFILVSMAHSSFMRYSERFSDILNRQFSKDLSLQSLGIKQAGFYVLVGASMPSVLVEAGFISNREDEKYLASSAGQAKIAESLYRAIASFKVEYEKNMQMEAAIK